ncbi:serine/threonine-protein kinase ULK1-like isoform X2 [Oscarella lobularis]|uniref:serine/threonine-protein kinase ULK1-like isoform X2 n=1 Tax=Oscarella lobularis TaxID=121494 RepID=UPI00331326CF
MAHTECIGDFQYEVKDLLGHGAFALVYKGRKRDDPSFLVAVKKITIKHPSVSRTSIALQKEMDILKRVNHSNVVRLYDHKKTENILFLVLEYCNGGDLAEYLHVKKTLSEETIRLFLRQIARAMKAIHELGVIHRDLKPQNILLSHPPEMKNPDPQHITLKLADFGFARFLAEESMAATMCGSPLYMAPEVLMSKQYDAKCDLWSIGTIVYQCLFGRAPFSAPSPQALKMFYESERHLEPRMDKTVSDSLKDLLTHLLRRDPKTRMPLDEFFTHSFIFDRKTAVSEPVLIQRRVTSYVKGLRSPSCSPLDDDYANVSAPHAESSSSSSEKLSEELFHPSSYQPPSLCRALSTDDLVEGDDTEDEEDEEDDGFLMVYSGSRRSRSRTADGDEDALVLGGPTSLPVAIGSPSSRQHSSSSPFRSRRRFSGSRRSSSQQSSPKSDPSSLPSPSSTALTRLLSFARSSSPTLQVSPSSRALPAAFASSPSLPKYVRRSSDHDGTLVRRCHTDATLDGGFQHRPFGLYCSPPSSRPLKSGFALFSSPPFIKRQQSTSPSTVLSPENDTLGFAPPTLANETIMDESHTKALNQLRRVSDYCKEILKVADRLSVESFSSSCLKNSEKLSLYLLCGRLLSESLRMVLREFGGEQMGALRVAKTTVKDVYDLQQLCFQQCEKMTVTSQRSRVTLAVPERLIFSHAMEMCQVAVLKVAAGTVSDQGLLEYKCVLRLFSCLLENVRRTEDKRIIQEGKDTLETFLRTREPALHLDCD